MVVLSVDVLLRVVILGIANDLVVVGVGVGPSLVDSGVIAVLIARVGIIGCIGMVVVPVLGLGVVGGPIAAHDAIVLLL